MSRGFAAGAAFAALVMSLTAMGPEAERPTAVPPYLPLRP